jgi:histone-lysine N-methyltransferase SETD2
LEQLSDEKVAKIKKFAKEYIAKVLRKMEKSGRPRPPSSTTTQAGSSTSLDTPGSAEGVDGGTADISMSVEEAMDMDPDTDDESESEDGNGEGRGPENGIDTFSGSTNFLGTLPAERTGDVMDVDESPDSSVQLSDPRRRLLVVHGDPEWDYRPPYMNVRTMS